MSTKQKKTYENKKLKTLRMEKKLKTSFTAMNIGLLVTVVISVANILLLGFGQMDNPVVLRRCIVAIVLLTIISFLLIMLSNTVAKSLSGAIVAPIDELKAAIVKIKEGNFDIELTYDGQDELAELGSDLKEACKHMSLVIDDANYMISNMADGKFNITSNARESYVGSFETLLVDMEKLNSQLNVTLNQIQEAAGHVMVGAEQLAGSAEELADGATNQAGAVEELSATVENVTNISEESAKNAVAAATNAKNVAVEAEESQAEIQELVNAMGRITETSKEIENIIAAIEDIASQTNLLSLNASIEAARAGEAGRGFAVVADQIGKLAADSAHSAVTTRELISKALTEIEAGNQIVENTMKSIETVLTNMETFAEMASGAAEASKVQVDMLKEIEAGIEQITIVVQNNSATAQETSAVSQELSSQSISLEDLVQKFELNK